MIKPLFKNGLCDYWQFKSIALATKPGKLNTWLWKYDAMIGTECDGKFVVPSKIRLADIALASGFVTSKSDFDRKCKSKAMKYNDRDTTVFEEIDITNKSPYHDLRCGKRRLEFATQG